MPYDGRMLPRRYQELLSNRNFALLLGGQTISRLGDGLQVAALLWLALQLGGGGAVALTAFATSAPRFVLGLIGGVYADRWNRRLALAACDAARGFAVLLIPLAAAFGALHVWQLVAIAALLSLGGTLADPASNALLPSLIRRDQLLAANALSGATLQASYWIGPALLGAILHFLAMKDVFTVDALSFGAALITDLLLRYRDSNAARDTGAGVVREIGEGMAIVRADLLLWLPLLVFALGIFFAAGAREVALPVLVGHGLHQSAGSFGIMLGAAGVGELLGNLIVGQFKIANKASATCAGWILLGLARAPLGLIPAWQMGAGLLLSSGGFSALTDAPLLSLMQERTGAAHLGRVMSLWLTLVYAADAVAAPAMGGLLALMPIAGVFLLAGLATSGIGLAGAIACRRREAAGPALQPAG